MKCEGENGAVRRPGPKATQGICFAAGGRGGVPAVPNSWEKLGKLARQPSNLPDLTGNYRLDP